MTIASNSPTASMRPQLLCVLGMHRSGTSVVTQFLHELGAAVAPQLIGAMAQVNPEGFWEDQCVVDLNERLLSARGRRWFDGDAIPAAGDARAEADLRAEAIRHFQENYAGHALSVVKDPRLCRLLPFWLEVWSQAALEPFFVHVVRHPFAVAKSLQKRDRMPLEYGVLLWLQHTLDALADSGGRPGLLVVYDDFLQNPLALAETLASRYGVALPGAPAAWRDAAARAVRPQLRHNDNDSGAALGLRRLADLAVALYDAIGAACRHGGEPVAAGAWRSRLQPLLDAYADELAMLNRLRAELMALSADAVRVGELHTGALAVIASKDSDIAHLNGVIAQRDATIADQDAAIGRLDSLVADRNQLISDLLHFRVWRLLPRLARRMSRT